MASHDIGVVSPDSFLLDQLDLHPVKVRRALVGQMTAAKRPPLTMGQRVPELLGNKPISSINTTQRCSHW